MKLEELAELYKDCSSYEGQYLPTFKKILHHLNSEDVRDIVTKYDEYKAIIPGIDSDAKRKHIRSLKQKLQIETDNTKTIVIKEEETSSDKEDISSEEEATDDEDDDMTKENKYRAYFNLTVKYIHLLPPDVIAQVCRIGFSD